MSRWCATPLRAPPVHAASYLPGDAYAPRFHAVVASAMPYMRDRFATLLSALCYIFCCCSCRWHTTPGWILRAICHTLPRWLLLLRWRAALRFVIYFSRGLVLATCRPSGCPSSSRFNIICFARHYIYIITSQVVSAAQCLLSPLFSCWARGHMILVHPLATFIFRIYDIYITPKRCHIIY